MTTYEKRIAQFMTDHLVPIVFVLITALGILMRIQLRDQTSGDSLGALIPWYEEIRQYGLSHQVGNYNFPYQLAIFLLTKLPLKPLHAYKLLSCSFDFLLAVISALVVHHIMQKTERALLTYCAVFLSPVVILNSAAWAQCDSIYVFFALFGTYLLLKNRTFSAMLCFGFSLAFKLQAVFLFPGLLILYFMRKDFPIWHFLAIPLGMVILSLPMLFVGRNLLELVQVYAWQSNTYRFMTMNYPSFYSILSASNYEIYAPMAILLTISILTLLLFYIAHNKIQMNAQNTVMLLFLSAFTCVLFLPAMHERYGYPYEILAWVLTFLIPQSAPLCIGLLLISLRTYGAYLFGAPIHLTWLAIGNACLYGMYVYLFLRKTHSSSREIN